jgi:hypothetical protein
LARLTVTLTVLAAAVLAACGGGDAPSPAGEKSPAATVRASAPDRPAAEQAHAGVRPKAEPAPQPPAGGAQQGVEMTVRRGTTRRKLNRALSSVLGVKRHHAPKRRSDRAPDLLKRTLQRLHRAERQASAPPQRTSGAGSMLGSVLDH